MSGKELIGAMLPRNRGTAQHLDGTFINQFPSFGGTRQRRASLKLSNWSGFGGHAGWSRLVLCRRPSDAADSLLEWPH